MKSKWSFQQLITPVGLVLSLAMAGGALPVLAGHEADRERDTLRERAELRDGEEFRDREYQGNRDSLRGVTEIVLSEVLFGDRDRRILDDYLRAEPYETSQRKHKKLPPGLRKKLDRGGQLPPGWQKKMTRWEVMDADVYRHSTRLPEHIARQLSGSPAGTSIRRVEDRIVRIMDATHTIVDILNGGRRDY